MLGFVLGLLQMLLYAIYRNRGEKTIQKEKKTPIEPLKSIVIETQLVEKNEQKDGKSEESIATGV